MERLIRQLIAKNNSLDSNERFMNQTWDDFKSACTNHEVFIFGAGVLTKLLLNRNTFYNLFKGIIDNDEKKQGRLFSDYYDDIKTPLKIISVNELLRSPSDKIVVLIASSNYYEEIADQLEEIGIKYYFSMLHMDYKAVCSLMNSGCDNLDDDDIKELSKEEFAIQCAEQELVVHNKIVFYDVFGSGNHETNITKQLLNIRNDLDVVWIVSDLSKYVPQGVRTEYMGKTKACISEMETARVCLTGQMFPMHLFKRPDQVYIHLKHWASITLKKFFLDAPSVSKLANNRKLWEWNSRLMDYIFIGSSFDAESCKRGLSQTATMVYVGSPRSDTLFSKNNIKQAICNQYQLPGDSSILLFAPTYRFLDISTDTSAQYALGGMDLDFQGILAEMKRCSGKNWFIFLRLHPGVVKFGNELSLPDGVINVSDYPDSEELVAASDAMISDYSSIMFEPAFVRKPVFLYAPDQETYIDNEYELLLDYHSLPFPIAATNEELVHNIATFDYERYVRDVDTFMEKYGVHEDGHASERAAQFIIDLMTKRNEE